MNMINLIALIIASITLFLFGLQSFSAEIKNLASGPLEKILKSVTSNKVKSFILGGVATAFLQSSSATTAIALSLAEASLISFSSTLALMLGANIGTASTAFLMSMKLDIIGPYILIIGAALSSIDRLRVAGKTIFYFGFIFFALNQINLAFIPLKNNPAIIDILAYSNNWFIGVTAGLILAAILQSSSVLIGIAILLADQQLISIGGAISIVLGANIGTTSTSLISSMVMGKKSRIIAVSNLIFNFVGVLIVFPFIPLLEKFSISLSHGTSIGLAIAYSHLLFNSFIGVFFLLILEIYIKYLKKFVTL